MLNLLRFDFIQQNCHSRSQLPVAQLPVAQLPVDWTIPADFPHGGRGMLRVRIQLALARSSSQRDRTSRMSCHISHFGLPWALEGFRNK
jgi:hypothetical protein